MVDEINNQKQDMVIRAVRKMKERAQACVAVGGGVFEGRMKALNDLIHMF